MRKKQHVFPPYEPLILPDKMAATRVGSEWEPTLFIPCQLSTLPFIRGAMLLIANAQNFTGTDEEIRDAVNVLTLQAMADAQSQPEICGTPLEWGADFRAIAFMLQAMQGHDLVPPPWEFRLDVRGEPPDEEYWLQYRHQEGE